LIDKFRRLVLVAAAVLSMVASLDGSVAAPKPSFKILVFTNTVAHRHLISAALSAFREMGAANDFQVDTTEDPVDFTETNLDAYGAVVWLLTEGDPLNGVQQTVFENYIQAGGGFVGIHSAAETEPAWSWYQDLVGAAPDSHAAIQPATVNVLDRVHPSTASLPARWELTDEWYNFDPNPRGSVHVLATVDESTYTGGNDGYDHPIAWCQNYRGGRSWYTGGGDTAAIFSEPLFRQHLLGGVMWAAGEAYGDCTGTVWDSFKKVPLDEDTLDPFELDVAPDGRVFFVEFWGVLKIYDPALEATVLAGQIPVSHEFEDGLVGLALDPHFAETGWIYLYYSSHDQVPCGPTDTAPSTFCAYNRLSRFTVTGNTLDTSSEKIMLNVPVQRYCCHTSGALDFDSAGNLYLATGDNTNGFADNYAPIDERPGRSDFDAQRTSANTDDLRGKLLRIHPEPDGSYTIPAGNLFPPGTAKTRPEIYAMGFRNPFRYAVDPETGWVYLADHGPDARVDSPDRGPQGYVEWNLIKKAGNYGWPYCEGPNYAFRDYDYATGTPGFYFDCNAPTNDSPNNTGLTDLPPVVPADVWYPFGPSLEFPEMGSGCPCPSAGPAYHYDPGLDSDRKFPRYYDDTPFFYEWGRMFIKEFKLHQEKVLEINDFLPGVQFKRPMDMTFGPDGAMYLLEWGSDFFGNTDSGLYRIDYVGDNVPPKSTATLSPAQPSSTGWYTSPVTIQLSAQDGSGTGVRRIRFLSDDGGWTTYSAPLAIPDGAHSVSFRSTDMTGNVEPSQELNLKVDATAPTLTCTPLPSTLPARKRKMVRVAADVRFEDAGSGKKTAVLTHVSSNQPDAGMGRRDRPGDIKGWDVGSLDVLGRLRGEGPGARRYTLTYSGTDLAGNTATTTCTFKVERK
jgi:glucose/arabinose dehydrogenase/type 1 glutamine amidotransferase